ncbi:Do family serine endopeptidase [Hyphococcus luteus]|uniref:Probable periplasmic serine endoprotease DegP-like n=1 Tax=Hyphococcus luteus TaxID=2058213 RepID=A0A2S7K4A3_9PROT|nr:Do family serine endopeptidase [Marinicaulis flavus]PQA87333.1 serine protease [Marinicaulis flavus]
MARKGTFKSAFRGLLAGLTAAGALAASGIEAAAARGAPESFADLAENLTPAVVNISSAQRSRAGKASGELAPLQRKFDRPAVSLGSGFIIDASGIVVTNNHVIDNADEITVTLHDGRELSASLKGRDRETDLAVLQIEGGGKFPYVNFGDSDAARVGDWVIAIGNPFGLGGTVTVGIVSARNRDINSGQYDDYIQTDAAINRGNSGGPLFDLQGKVVGVNTAIYSQTGGSVGVGFAVPADLAETVVTQLLEYGETRRGWLGVSIDDVTPELAATLDLRAPKGAVVTVVRPNSPAADAGLEPNDVILQFNRRDIASVRDLTREVADTPIGATVPMEILRDGRRMTVQVRIDRRETRMLAAANAGGVLPANAAKGSGLTLQEPTEEIRQAYGLPATIQGVVVTAVDPESDAAIVLQPGDVILEIGWERVTRPSAAVDKLGKLKNLNSGPVQIYVQRGDLLFYESLRP